MELGRWWRLVMEVIVRGAYFLITNWWSGGGDQHCMFLFRGGTVQMSDLFLSSFSVFPEWLVYNYDT